MHPSPDVLALLALGEQAGTAEERIHVDGCPVCLAEVAEFVRVAAVGRSATATDELQPPRPEVWQAVRSELGLGEGTTAPPPSDGKVAEVPPETVQELPRDTSSRESTGTGSSAAVPHSGRRNSRGRRALSLALAAAAALVVGFGLGFLVDRIVQPTQTVVERAQLQALPAWPGATGEAWVERDSTGDRFLEVRVDSVRPDPGYREVWLIDSNVKAMSPMGYLNNGVGRFNIPDDLDLNQFPIVDVSAEPVNDADPTHSGDSILRGQLAS